MLRLIFKDKSNFFRQFKQIFFFTDHKKATHHYEVLKISPGATSDEIRSAYLEMLKKYHPDLNKSPDAT